MCPLTNPAPQADMFKVLEFIPDMVILETWAYGVPLASNIVTDAALTLVENSIDFVNLDAEEYVREALVIYSMLSMFAIFVKLVFNKELYLTENSIIIKRNNFLQRAYNIILSMPSISLKLTQFKKRYRKWKQKKQ